MTNISFQSKLEKAVCVWCLSHSNVIDENANYIIQPIFTYSFYNWMWKFNSFQREKSFSFQLCFNPSILFQFHGLCILVWEIYLIESSFCYRNFSEFTVCEMNSFNDVIDILRYIIWKSFALIFFLFSPDGRNQ